MTGKKKIQKAAFVVDVRGGAFFNDLKNVIAELKAMDDINSAINLGLDDEHVKALRLKIVKKFDMN